MFRLRNPAIRYRIMWALPRSNYGRVSPEPESAPARVMSPMYDGTMLLATVLMTIVGVITLGLQVSSV